MTHVPDGFRAVLKRELPEWVGEGIVTEETAQRLSQRYRLDELGREASRLLVAVILTIGALLIGGGVIAFVAAHWEGIPTALKVAMLFGAMLGLHAAGWWLWYERGWPRLGHALVFGACLVFGANIGLMAQIFHVRSDGYTGFGAWALGAIAMAWAARSVVTGLLALVTSFVWFAGFADRHENAAAVYPFLVAAAVLPLVAPTRSRVLYGAAWLAILIALCVVAGVGGESAQAVLLAASVGGLMAWAAGEFHRTTGMGGRFGGVAAVLGVVALSIAAYLWSFLDMVRALRNDLELSPWCIAVAAAAVGAIALLAAAWRKGLPAGPRLVIALGVVGAALVLCAGALIGETGDGIPVVIGANAAAIVLAGVAIASGMSQERRSHFWLGTLFAVLLVLSRFLEYDTGLLLKSAAFIACGIAVLFAGVQYERRLRGKEKAHG